MLLSDFITVALIPTLLTNSTGHDSIERTDVGFDGNNENGFRTNSRQLRHPRSSSEEREFFGDKVFDVGTSFFEQRGSFDDPILREIYDEERQLNLNDGDFNMRSEEARDLINFQRQKFPSEQDLTGASRARNLLLPDEGQPDFVSGFQNPGSGTTEFPVLLPSPNPTEMEMDPTTSASRRRSPGRFGFGIINNVVNRVDNAVGHIRKSIFGSSSGSSNQGSEINIEPEAMQLLGLNCSGNQIEFNGGCHNALQSDQCPPGQWLIEDDTTGAGKCVENLCANQPNTAYFGGKCVVVRTEGDCHPGMITYIYKNGEVECDCKEKYLFYRHDGNCYPAFRRGPCKIGEVLRTKITEKGAHPAYCERSKCSQDGLFCNAPVCPRGRNCVELGSKCPVGTFDISTLTLQPACIPFDEKIPDQIIGNVPTLQCAPGSRRDILGTCRKPSKITFS